jgi:hypothetical protein
MSLDPVQAHRFMAEAAFQFAGSSPLEAIATLAKAVKHQPLGGRRAIARVLVETLLRDEPRRGQLLDGIREDIGRM